MADDNVVPIKNAKIGAIKAALADTPVGLEWKGPFTVTIAGPNGVMYQVEFPDQHGELPDGENVLATDGCEEILVDLLTGTLRVFLGAVQRTKL